MPHLNDKKSEGLKKTFEDRVTGLLSFLALLSFIAYFLNSFAIRGFFRQTFELIKKLAG